jgi:hypothetical protein
MLSRTVIIVLVPPTGFEPVKTCGLSAATVPICLVTGALLVAVAGVEPARAYFTRTHNLSR